MRKRGDKPDHRPNQGRGRSEQADASASAEDVAAAAVSCTSSVPSGADYLCATYDMGIRKAGWKAGAYPLNHVGQHIYVDQGGATSASKLRTYLQDVRNAYVAYEGTSTSKKIQVTEIGWESTGSMTPQLQADNLATAFGEMRNTTYIGRAYWFFVQDIPEAGLYFGLQTGGDFPDNFTGTHKPSFSAYKTSAAY